MKTKIFLFIIASLLASACSNGSFTADNGGDVNRNSDGSKGVNSGGPDIDVNNVDGSNQPGVDGQARFDATSGIYVDQQSGLPINPFGAMNGNKNSFQDVCAATKYVKSISKPISFAPKRAMECQRFAGDTKNTNLGGTFEGKINGYGIQSGLIFTSNLPQIICDLEIDSVTKNFDHDDSAILTFSGASALKVGETLNQYFLIGDIFDTLLNMLDENGVYIYRFPKVKGASHEKDFNCARNASRCEFPIHQGGVQPVAFKLDSQNFEPIAAHLGATVQAHLNLSVFTDDNNTASSSQNGDCSHTGLDLLVKYRTVVVR